MEEKASTEEKEEPEAKGQRRTRDRKKTRRKSGFEWRLTCGQVAHTPGERREKGGGKMDQMK